MGFPRLRGRRKQGREQVPNDRIVDADSWFMAKITDAWHTGFRGHCVERLAREMKHEGMERVSQVGDGVRS